MREIKFRAWHRGHNKMYTVKAMDFIDNIQDEILLKTDTQIGYIIANLRQCDIIQYTGLLDKNGKKIYEGDIIQFFDRGNMLDNELLPCTAQVIMKFAGWYPEPINVKGLRGFKFAGANWGNEQCEVIGNIYENPELLK